MSRCRWNCQAYLLFIGGAAGKTGGGDVTIGIDGITGVALAKVGATVLTGPGTGATEETPRFPNSIEPRGIPVRGLPPGTVGDVGVEEVIKLPEPEPHIPDMPAVSIAPEAEVVDIPEVAEMPDEIPGDAAVAPDAAPVAGIELATDSPPPS